MQMEDVMSTIGFICEQAVDAFGEECLESRSAADHSLWRSISLDTGKRVMAAAEAEALKNHGIVVVAIVDSGGHLKMLHRTDNTQSPQFGWR